MGFMVCPAVRCVEFFQRGGAGEKSKEVIRCALDELVLPGSDVEFVAGGGAGQGEIGAAEDECISIHKDHFFVLGLVAAEKEGPDSRDGQLGGGIAIGVPDGRGGGGTVFTQNANIQAGFPLFLQRIENGANGAPLAGADVVGGNPDGSPGGANRFQRGLGKGLGGEDFDCDGGRVLAKAAGLFQI